MSAIAIVGSGLVGRAWAIILPAPATMYGSTRDAGAAAAAQEFAGEALPILAAEGLLDDQGAATVAARLSLHQASKRPSPARPGAGEHAGKCRRQEGEIYAARCRGAGRTPCWRVPRPPSCPRSSPKHLPGRHRCLVVHPINPPYLIPAAEIVPAPWTAPDVVERTRGLMTAMGQAPIVMKKEIDGFVMNRMQGALLEEAFRLVADGYASVEDVDVGIRDGLALRWSFMGPFETIDLNAPGGIRDYVVRYQQIYERLFPSMQRRVDWAGPVLDGAEADRRQKAAGSRSWQTPLWRDRRLMAPLAHKRKAVKTIGS